MATQPLLVSDSESIKSASDEENFLSPEPLFSGSMQQANLDLYPSGGSVISLSIGTLSGSYHSCGVDLTGEIVCWGSNQYGQLGLGQASVSVRIPTKLNNVGVTGNGLSVSAGDDYTCAVYSNGEGYCMGAGQYGVLGDGTSDNQALPTLLPMPNGVQLVDVATATLHAGGLTLSNGVDCWGDGG